MISKNDSSPRWNEVTAIFGGRFDPPHMGHREAVRGLFKIPGIRQVLVIPSASPPHKPCRASAEDRAELASLNFRSTPLDTFPSEVKIDLCELDRSRKKPRHPSYSYETLLELGPLYSSIAFVVGTDQFSQLHQWYRFPDILRLCHWIVLDRKLETSSVVDPILREWQGSGLIRATSPTSTNSTATWQVQGSNCLISLVPTEAPALSSTFIREAISQTGSAPENALLPEVSAYLKVRGIYGIK